MRFARSLLVLFAVVPSIITRADGFSSSQIQQDDRKVVQGQLGYLPSNFLCVSARTEQGSPIAIKTYPLLQRRRDTNVQTDTTGLSNILVSPSSSSSRGAPFPTHYWLTCPLIARAIGEVCDANRHCRGSEKCWRSKVATVINPLFPESTKSPTLMSVID
jgi:Protein of unknown function (DUF501)